MIRFGLQIPNFTFIAGRDELPRKLEVLTKHCADVGRMFGQRLLIGTTSSLAEQVASIVSVGPDGVILNFAANAADAGTIGVAGRVIRATMAA